MPHARYKMKTGALGLVSCLLLASCNWLDSENQPFTEITLQETSCWFDPPASNPATECYFMHVPQDYDEPDDRWIYFPVVMIRQGNSGPGKNPVLHLGGGGPGNASNEGEGLGVVVLVHCAV